MKITSLTKAQKAMLPEIRDEWMRYGISTEPVCLATIEPLFAQLYLKVGFARPQVYLLDSPLAALAATNAYALVAPSAAVRSAVTSEVRSAVHSAVTSAVTSEVRSAVRSAVHSAVTSAVTSEVRSAVRSAVDSAVTSAVTSAVRSAVHSAVDSAVRSAVDSAVRSAVDSAVTSAVHSAVDSAVRSAVDSAVTSEVRSAVGSYWGGSMWPAWAAYIETMRRIGVELPAAALLYAELTKHVGWYWMLPGVVFASQRPSEIHLVDGRLHNEHGPAVNYPDSATQIWSIRGVTVNEQIVLRPEAQTIDEIKRERNAEVKRIRIERFGWGDYLRATKARVIEHIRNDVSQSDESLMDCDGMRILVCACPSTARVYSLEVPPNCSTVEQAQNFLSGGRARRILGAT